MFKRGPAETHAMESARPSQQPKPDAFYSNEELGPIREARRAKARLAVTRPLPQASDEATIVTSPMTRQLLDAGAPSAVQAVQRWRRLVLIARRVRHWQRLWGILGQRLQQVASPLRLQLRTLWPAPSART